MVAVVIDKMMASFVHYNLWFEVSRDTTHDGTKAANGKIVDDGAKTGAKKWRRKMIACWDGCDATSDVRCLLITGLFTLFTFVTWRYSYATHTHFSKPQTTSISNILIYILISIVSLLKS